MARGGRRAVERQRAHALEPQALDVDVGDRHLALRGKALGLREQRAELVDRRLAVPREVGRALARSGRRIDVRGLAAHRLRRAEHRAIVRLADDDVRRRQIAEDQRAGERALRRRRVGAQKSSQISTWKTKSGRSDAANTRSVPNGTVWPASVTSRPATPDARREPAILVVLAIVRQERLRHDAEDPPARDRRRRSCRGGRCGAPARRRRTPGAARCEASTRLRKRRFDAVEQRVLQQQVVDRVGGQARARGTA